MSDNIKFLTGTPQNLEKKSVVRGQVYFTVDSNKKGQIVFDAPISASQTERIIMSENVKYADSAGAVGWSNITSKPNLIVRNSTVATDYPIVLNNDKTSFTLYYSNGSTYGTYTLAPEFLPLTGGRVSGELYSESLTAESLLVTGAARFVNTIQGTIEKANGVNQTAVTASDYTDWRTLIFGASSSETEGFTPTTQYGEALYATNVLSVQPSTGTIRAKNFKAISGSFTAANTGFGLYLTDSASNQYAGIYDNGTNLWVGATSSEGMHHKGTLFLSVGYTGTIGQSGVAATTGAYLSFPTFDTSFKINGHTSRIIVNGTAGNSTTPVFINSDGQPTATTYSLNATINAGAVNRLSYYSGANAISQASSLYTTGANLGINATTTTVSSTDYTLYVNGNSYLNGTVNLNGKIYLKTSDVYGDTLPTSGTTGQIFFKKGASASGGGTAESASKVTINDDTASKLYVLGATGTGALPIYRESSVYMQDNVLYGAAWNDYAECRETYQYIEPGRCVCENGDGTLSLSYKRLQSAPNIVSDTFGFIIGKTEKANTPLAVSGRVLVYTYEDRNSFKAGDVVCSGPEGTVSKMTREEIQMYPDKIVGIVSEIPHYSNWGEGNVKVRERIWIKVK